MQSNGIEDLPDTSRRSEFFWRCGLALVLVIYSLGLTRQLTEPWIGMHDWNGAFYSQLARNFLRYPWSCHHGMPLVAAGPSAPPDERSLYATHPAGLVWLLATVFRFFGEAESTARLTAIVASLIALAVWTVMIRRSLGVEVALVTGFLYAVTPMSVFFGRMVNHEAYGLCGMMGAWACWQKVFNRDTEEARRACWLIGWSLCIFATISIDWPGALFAGLFCVHALIRWRQRRISGSVCTVVWAVSAMAVGGILWHIVYGGLDGSWRSLLSVMLSRSGGVGESLAGGAWRHTRENLTPVGIACAALGLLVLIGGKNRFSADRHTDPSFKSSHGLEGLWVLTATGVIWLAVFWRQYQIHQYWLFYLGPVIALLSSVGILALRDVVDRNRKWVGDGLFAIAIVIFFWFARNQQDDLFRRRSWKPEFVEAGRRLRDTTAEDARVVVPVNPIRIERFGDYQFRNIVPPQLLWYLDRTMVGPADVVQPTSRASSDLLK